MSHRGNALEFGGSVGEATAGTSFGAVRVSTRSRTLESHRGGGKLPFTDHLKFAAAHEHPSQTICERFRWLCKGL